MVNFTPQPAEDRIGETIDHLILTELRSPHYIQVPLKQLYARAREIVGSPLALTAARGIADRTTDGDVIFVSAGFVVPPWMPNSESDGPIAAITLARALINTFASRVVLITDSPVISVLQAGARAAGLRIVGLDQLASTPRIAAVANAISIIDFPLEEEAAAQRGEELIRDFDPKAVICIERAGPNEFGVIHTAFGNDLSASTAKVHKLVEAAGQHGVFTVGCLDLGNEIGGGGLYETTRQYWPHGAHCNCPCGGGIACVVETDIPLVGLNSAWGASAICACLALLTGKDDVAVSAELEEEVMKACLQAGMMDAATLAPTLTLSGAHVREYGHILELMRAMPKFMHRFHRPMELRK